MAPTPLPDALFQGVSSNAARALSKAAVQNFAGDADRMLRDYGLDDSPVAMIGLTPSADGKQVTDGRLFFRGRAEPRVVTFAASRFWPHVANDVELEILLPALQDVIFVNGSTTSDFIPDAEVTHTLRKAPQDEDAVDIPEAEKGTHGIGDFTLRVICHLDSSSSTTAGVVLRHFYVLYPNTEDFQAQVAPDAHADPRWPGFRLADGRTQVGPKPSRLWGCPVTPALLMDPAKQPPPPGVLRAAIEAILNTGAPPDGCRDSISLDKKWEKVKRIY